MPPVYDAAIIGGGFFGCSLACYLRQHYARVVLLEKEADLLQRASYANQARVHSGYHYPRSLLTALRSRINFPLFVNEYRECIDDTFTKYYAIGRKFSKVTARQFYAFCKRIGAPVSSATGPIRRYFSSDLIEEVFLVEEYAFDAVRLKERMWTRLRQGAVEVLLQTTAQRLKRNERGDIAVTCATPQGPRELAAHQVFVCAYAQLNQVLRGSGMPIIPLKHECTEMALVEVPEPLRRVGVTVMCGPFFSFMPFPPRGLHTLSHVRFTPHEAWQDGVDEGVDADAMLARAAQKSSYPSMLCDVKRYMPIMAGMRYVDSIWEVKTVLPRSESDDSRPILFRWNHGLPNVHCVLGGKIDNVYDAFAELDLLFQERKVA